MICPKCRREIPDGSKFCQECGSNLSALSGGSDVEREEPLVHPSGKVSGPGEGAGPAPGTSSVDLSMKSIVGDAAAEAHEAALDGAPLAERYEIIEEIGRGGFAAVFKARDKRLDRVVAVKRLLADRTAGAHAQQTVERFTREARAIASLNHRNIVQVFDHNRDDEGHYIVMEYVDGGSLRDLLRDGGKLPLEQTVGLMTAICRGLALAHRKNLVHRDIKPANILLSREGDELVPKIVDFGLARAGFDSTLSVSGYGMGTPYYMPPEQRRDAKSVNHTADIYALGKTLYEMVTGEIPDNVDPDVIPPPPALAKVILKCIKTRPEERYFSVDDLARDLDALRGGAAAARAIGPTAGLRNPCPNCGTGNPEDEKFCGSCGTGLTRLCPECERENSIHRQFCGGCGTDVEGFAQAQDALQRMQASSQDKRWSRVTKEFGLLPEDPRLPGAKGTQMAQAIQRLNAEAVAALKKRDELKTQIDAAMGAKELARALELVTQYREIDPHKPDMNELPARLLRDMAQQAFAEGHYARAAEHWQRLLELTSGDEQAQAGLQEARRAHLDELRKLGRTLVKQKKFDAALEAWSEALDLAPADQELREQRDRTRTTVETIATAIAAAKRCLTSDNDAAISACRKVLALDKNHADALALRAKAEKNIADSKSLKGRGENCLASGEFGHAIELLSAASKLHASDRSIPKLIGGAKRSTKELSDLLANARACLGRKEYRNCVRHCNAALRLQPQNTDARAMLAKARRPIAVKRAKAVAVVLIVLVIAAVTVVGVYLTDSRQRSERPSRPPRLSTKKPSTYWAGPPDTRSRRRRSIVHSKWPFDADEARRRQRETAAALGVKVEQDFELARGVTITMVLVPAGEFLMGSAVSAAEVARLDGGEAKIEWYQREHPQHRVTISRPFWLSKHEVTQAQWEAVMGGNPSKFRGPENPVEGASWNDAQEFLRKLNSRAGGRPFTLPTEGQWEYACRAGTATPFHFGDTISTDQVNYDGKYPYGGGAKGEYRERTTPVGSFPANAWGLCDMHGNLWEWCQDWYGRYPAGAQRDPTGPTRGDSRVLRGGSWRSDAGTMRCAYRATTAPGQSDCDRGFRVSRPLP